jgi:hypothetical protein
MKDGLYQVTTDRFCAGFVVERGTVTECAPILRKRINYWKTKGTLIMAIDPFAPATDEAQTEAPTVDAPADYAGPFEATPGDANYSTLILKGGAGYGAPSVSIRAASASDLKRSVEDNFNDIKKLLELAAQLGKGFGILVDGDKPARGGSGNAAPAAKPEPKAGDPECPPGWTYKTGSKNGKTWRAYMPPQGSGESPMWLK